MSLVKLVFMDVGGHGYTALGRVGGEGDFDLLG